MVIKPSTYVGGILIPQLLKPPKTKKQREYNLKEEYSCEDLLYRLNDSERIKKAIEDRLNNMKEIRSSLLGGIFVSESDIIYEEKRLSEANKSIERLKERLDKSKCL